MISNTNSVLVRVACSIAIVAALLTEDWTAAVIFIEVMWLFRGPNTRKHGWAAYAFIEKRNGIWKPVLIGRYRWRWQACLMGRYHNAFTQHVAATWAEFHKPARNQIPSNWSKA